MKRESGFTLIELLIALTLGAIVLSAARAAFSTAVDTERRASRVAVDLQSWRFFSARLQRDLKNVIASDSQRLQGKHDALSFFTDQEDVGIRQVQYGYAGTAQGGQIRRVDLEAKTGSIVYEGVKGVQFRYLDGEQWKDTASSRLPAAIACKVNGPAGDRELMVILDVETGNER